jgi:hypothetical protein
MLFYRVAQIRQPFLIRLPTSHSLLKGVFISARFHEYAAGTEVVGDNRLSENSNSTVRYSGRYPRQIAFMQFSRHLKYILGQPDNSNNGLGDNPNNSMGR